MRKHLLILMLYTLLAVALTWPLAAHFGTHVSGDGSDDPALTWNLWWFKHAVLSLQQSPLLSDYMFYPLGINLVFYTLTLLNDALSLPLQAVFGLVPAANILLLSSFTLSGYGAYLLATDVLRRRRANLCAAISPSAFVAGLVYAFASCKFLYASLGQFNIASSQWIPFYVLYLFKLSDDVQGSRFKVQGSTFGLLSATSNLQSAICNLQSAISDLRPALMAALFLLLQSYAEFTFGSFLIIFTGFFLLAHLWSLKIFMRLMTSLGVSGVVFVVGFAPMLWPMIQEMRVEGDFLVQGSGFAEAFSADVIGFLTPSQLHPWWAGLASHFDFAYINFVFIGYATLALALIGAWQTRRTWLGRFWSLTTLAFVLIALGPTLRIAGHEFTPPFMPFNLFQWLPFFKGNRYPSRYAVMIALGIAVLVGLGMQSLSVKWRTITADRGNKQARPWPDSPYLSPLIYLLVCSLLLFEHLPTPMPLSDFRVPSFYAAIHDEPGDFTILELPLAWRNGFRVTGALEERAGKAFMLAQYYQTAHQKRMLSGNTSRNPELKFQYFTEAPFINSLIALGTGHALDEVALRWDKQYAREVLRFFNVRYIVLRPEAGDQLRPYLESLLPELQLWREEHGVRVYRLASLEGDGVAIAPTSPLARLYFAEGWGELGETRVWAQRRETRLLLPMQKKDGELVMRLIAPDDGQQMTLLINGHAVGTMPLKRGTHEYRMTIGKELAHDGVNEIMLQWRNLYATATLHYPDESIISAKRFVVVKSAGQEVGDFAHIWLDGRDVSPNQRGYNLASFMVGIDSGDATGHFDTFASTSASKNLMARLELELFRSVALAVRDEASRNMTAQLTESLQKLGAAANVGWRWSHAFIRYEHRGQISVREDASLIRPAIVSIGERISAPQVAGALEWLEVR